MTPAEEFDATYSVINIDMINFNLFEDVVFGHTEPLPIGIEVSNYSKSYNVGDEFEFDGKIYALYSDGSLLELSVDDVTIEEPDMSKDGEKNIAVTYTVDGNVFTCYITIQVEAPVEPELVECVFRCGDDKAWAISNDAIFRIWAWGGEYDEGAWVFAYPETSGSQLVLTATLYNNVEGIIIVRCDPLTEFPMVWDSSLDGYVWNQTENIVSLAFAEDNPSFHFEGAPVMTNYNYLCTSNFNIESDNAIFRIWAWGGEYGAGTWLDVNVNGRFDRETGRYSVSFSAYNNAAGFVFCRINPADAENLPGAPWPEGWQPWNQSGNLLELGEGVTTFNL